MDETTTLGPDPEATTVAPDEHDGHTIDLGPVLVGEPVPSWKLDESPLHGTKLETLNWVTDGLLDELEAGARDATLDWVVDDPIVAVQYPMIWGAVVRILEATGRGPFVEHDELGEPVG